MNLRDTAQIASVANSQIVQQQPQQDQHPHPQYSYTPGDIHDTKRKAEDWPQSASSKLRRSRYISLACNDCKRRKIKCNGQTPCQRCGNLNLDCVYAPHCCNGLMKDSQEYKVMAAHITSLQEQVNMLFDNLNNLRGILGQPIKPVHQQIQQQQPSHRQLQTSMLIDPSLQNHAFSLPEAVLGAPTPISPSHVKQRNYPQQQQQHSYRGPTSADFSFGVTKKTLQTMGITPWRMDGCCVFDGEHGEGSPPASPGQMERSMQLLQDVHEEKDPIHKVSKEEALRFCQVYDEEIGLMYPILNINTVIAHTGWLYQFIDATRQTGFMQQGFPDPDPFNDDNTIVLKMIIACASTMEGSGRSDLGRRMFESPSVQDALKKAQNDTISIKAVRLLTILALLEFHRDNQVASWRIVGSAARRCVELGLHRHEKYDAMSDQDERTEATLLFWSVYILDRKFSFGTGMPFALQDTDVDPLVPKPEGPTSYSSAMARFCEISNRVWRTVSKTPTAANNGSGTIDAPEMAYLDHRVVDWRRSIPASLTYEHPFQQVSTSAGSPPSRGSHRLRIILYLTANHMRVHIYRPVLHSATSIMQNRGQAQGVVDVAKDTIRVLTHVSQTSDIYHTQQALFSPFVTGALVVLFLTVSHTPAVFADNVREEFYMALDLVRVLSKGSPISDRLWHTIRHLEEIAPKLGLVENKDNSRQPQQQHHLLQQLQNNTQSQLRAEDSLSRSAAIYTAGLNEMGLYIGDRGSHGGQQSHQGSWSASTGHSSSPKGIMEDLTTLFEAAEDLQAMGHAQGQGQG